MNLYPCAYSMTFNVADGKLNAILNQRSQDMLVANGWNVCQYAALVVMIARDAGLTPGTLLHVIADAHIYDRHIPIVEELISRKTYDAPKLVIADDVRSFYDFTAENIYLENYECNGGVGKIPVAI